MRLHSISMRNIRSHADTRVEFGDGITVFRGDMGSGKSTILMAAEFALFGMGGMSADTLVTKGQSRGEVSIAFEAGGREYEVHRAISVRNGRAAQTDTGLVEDGVSEILTPTDLKARVLGILGFREPTNPKAVSRVYRYAIYTPQEEIKAILSGDGREEIIRRAFGMDDYKTAADNAKVSMQRMAQDMKSLEPRFERLGEFEDGVTDMETEAERLGGELERLGSERLAAAGAVSDAEAASKKLERSLAKAEAAAATVNRLEADLAAKQGEMAGLLDDIKSAGKEFDAAEAKASKDPGPRPTSLSGGALDGMISDAREREAEAREAAASLRALSAEADALTGECDGRSVDDAKAELDSLRQSMSGLELRIAEAEDAWRASGDRAAALLQEASSIKESLAKAESLGSECEWCGTRLDEGHGERLAAERRKMMEAAEKDGDAAADAATESRAKAAGLRSELDEARGMAGNAERALAAARKLEPLAERIESIREGMVSAGNGTVDAGAPRLPDESDSGYLERVRASLTAWSDASSRAALARREADMLSARMQEMWSRHATAKERASALESEMEGMRGEAAEAERVKAEAAKAEAELERLRASLDGIIAAEAAAAERRGAAEAEAERLRGEATEARRHKEHHARLGDCAEWIRSPFIPALQSIESQVMASALYEFREHYREWYTILVDDHTKRSGIGEGFVPTMEQDGIEQDISNLSGGERTSVALAYRLALNAMVRRQTGMLDDNLLVLDEPTDGFSREQMSKVLDILVRLDARQVIVVSHEPEMEGYADTVFRVTKSDGRSRVARA